MEAKLISPPIYIYIYIYIYTHTHTHYSRGKTYQPTYIYIYIYIYIYKYYSGGKTYQPTYVYTFVSIWVWRLIAETWRTVHVYGWYVILYKLCASAAVRGRSTYQQQVYNTHPTTTATSPSQTVRPSANSQDPTVSRHITVRTFPLLLPSVCFSCLVQDGCKQSHVLMTTSSISGHTPSLKHTTPTHSE